LGCDKRRDLAEGERVNRMAMRADEDRFGGKGASGEGEKEG